MKVQVVENGSNWPLLKLRNLSGDFSAAFARASDRPMAVNALTPSLTIFPSIQRIVIAAEGRTWAGCGVVNTAAH